MPCHSTETEIDAKHTCTLGEQDVKITDAEWDKAEETLKKKKLGEAYLLSSDKSLLIKLSMQTLMGFCLGTARLYVRT